MDNSQRYSYGPPFEDPAGLDSGVYGGGAPGPPMAPPPGPGHAWGMYQHPPPPAQHQWPPFPPVNPGGPYPAFDPSRPPPRTFGPPQWSPTDPPFRGQFPPNQHQLSNSAPAMYQPSIRSDRQIFFSDQPVNRLWSDEHHSRSAQTDEDSEQRLRDERWTQSFLLGRKSQTPDPKQPRCKASISQFRQQLYGTVRMVSELKLLCQMMAGRSESDGVWVDALPRAAELKTRIQERLTPLRDPECVSSVRRKLALISRKRARMRRRRAEQREERQEEEARRAEREAAVDKWQMKRIQEVEEKNREKELKLAADAVLSEVRRKQADAVRMQDILRSLEKLRKLRKEAAARKGMFPEKESDDRFEGHLKRLRALIGKRMAVYSAEEKALRVMLEGEQEEERKRDREKHQRKEREKLLQKKREIESMLFGDELPASHIIQPFQDYYTQAERSLPALIHLRREWDQFLVPAEHPDGTSVPQGWVLPDQPSDEIWATALEKCDT